jgi:hypothetical protein
MSFMRRFRLALFGAGLAVLGACVSPTEPAHSASGVWRGGVGQDTLTLSLVMHPDRSVSGDGVDSAAGGVSTFPIRGTVSGSTVLLLFTPSTVESGFSGRFTTATRIDGSLDLPGFAGPLSLARR